MCINTGLAEAGLENIEPQKGTETILEKDEENLVQIREYRTPEGDGNPFRLLAFNQSIAY